MNALGKLGQHVVGQANERFGRLASAAFHSVRDGSAVTGAPGQPRAHGDLYASWLLIHDSSTSALISSDSDHAAPIEEGINRWGPIVFKTGGPHGMALTAANLDRLAEIEFPVGWANR